MSSVAAPPPQKTELQERLSELSERRRAWIRSGGEDDEIFSVYKGGYYFVEDELSDGFTAVHEADISNSGHRDMNTTVYDPSGKRVGHVWSTKRPRYKSPGEHVIELDSVELDEGARGRGLAREVITLNLELINSTYPPGTHFSVQASPTERGNRHMSEALRYLYNDIAQKTLGMLPIEEIRRRGKMHDDSSESRESINIYSKRFAPSVFEHLVAQQYDRALREAGARDAPDVRKHMELAQRAPFVRPPRLEPRNKGKRRRTDGDDGEKSETADDN